MRAARRVIARLSLSRRIPPDALCRQNDTSVRLVGLCSGAAAHELFLAHWYSDRPNQTSVSLFGLCGGSAAHSAVRALDVPTGRLNARDAYTPPNGELVSEVAYSAESDSLFVATYRIDKSGDIDEPGVIVRSFARLTDGQWSECHRMQLAREGNNRSICLRVLRDGTLLCSQWGTDGIHVCRAHSDRSLQPCARVTLPATHEGFDAQLAGNEKRLAAALSDGSVALFRVDNGARLRWWLFLERTALVQLSRVMLAGARRALFCGDSLLVGVATGGEVREAVSFTTTDGRLQHDRQLIPRDDRLDVWSWCFVEINRTLFAWDYISKELLDFNAA